MSALSDVQSQCTICLGELQGKSCHTLVCHHEFHVECLLNWFASTASGNLPHCPLCRSAFTLPTTAPRFEQTMSPVSFERRTRFIEEQYRKNPTVFSGGLGRSIDALRGKRKQLKESWGALKEYQRSDEFKNVYQKYIKLVRTYTQTEDRIEALEHRIASYPVSIMMYEIKNVAPAVNNDNSTSGATAG